MQFSIIAALAANGVIGDKGVIPWHNAADLKRFKELTTGHCVIMGRKTWESLPRKPLVGRENIVVSSTMRSFEGVAVVKSLDEALHLAWSVRTAEPFVIGGADLYAEALKHPHAKTLYLTRMMDVHTGDVWFPQELMGGWECQKRSRRKKDGSVAAFDTYMTFEIWRNLRCVSI